jgi:NitT/TauT family transport system substrate-binding protein
MNSISSHLNRRQVLWLLGGLGGSLALHSCSAPSQSSKLILGTAPWPGYSGLYTALGKGLFKAEGVDVEEVFFQSASEVNVAFLAGRTEISTATSGDAIEMSQKDPTIRIIYVMDYSDGSDGIIGRGIKSPQDLKGKSVARENLLFENVLLRAYLAKGGLTEKDINIKDLSAADGATAFAAKQVDVAVSYEPWMTKAAKEGGGEVLFTTKGTNLIADVILTRQKTIETRKDELLAYLRAVSKGVELVKSGDAEAIALTAGKLNVSKEEAKEQMSGVKIMDINDNKTMTFNPTHPTNVLKNIELTMQTAVDTKLIEKPMAIDSLYNDSLVMSL